MQEKNSIELKRIYSIISEEIENTYDITNHENDFFLNEPNFFANDILVHNSQHAAGVLVSSDKLMDNVALGRSRGNIVTGWQEGSDYHELSDLGYYKFDILGLNNLQVVNDCVSLVEARHGVKIDLAGLDLQEKEVYEKVVAAQDHMGVFQFECLAGDSIVDGISIKERFEKKILGNIRSVDETTHKIISNEVLGVANSGKKVLYEIELENGKTIRASKYHQFLTKKGWKLLEELTEEDEILSED